MLVTHYYNNKHNYSTVREVTKKQDRYICTHFMGVIPLTVDTIPNLFPEFG